MPGGKADGRNLCSNTWCSCQCLLLGPPSLVSSSQPSFPLSLNVTCHVCVCVRRGGQGRVDWNLLRG